jgi:hypothetical protein
VSEIVHFFDALRRLAMNIAHAGYGNPARAPMLARCVGDPPARLSELNPGLVAGR